MAGISTLEGFDYRGQLPNFSRDLFNTVADMVAFSENYLPEVFITQVVEDGKHINISEATSKTQI